VAIITGVKSPYMFKKDDSQASGLEMSVSSDDSIQYL